MIGELFDDWVASGQDWCQSALYLNSLKTSEQRKVGKYCMRTFAYLREKFGDTVAKSIRENKKDLQSKRKSEKDPIWTMVHPDCPQSEEPCIHLVLA